MLQLGRNLDGSRRGFEQGTQVGRRACDVARIPRHAGGVLQQAAPARAVGQPVEHAIVGRQQLVPLLVDGAENGEPFERPVGAWVERQDALEEFDDRGGFAGIPFLDEAKRALTDGGDQVGTEAGREGLAIGGRHVIGLLGLHHEGIEVIPCPHVRGLRLDLLQGGLEFLGGTLI